MKGYLHIVDLHVYQQSVATIIQKIGGLCRTKTRRGTARSPFVFPPFPRKFKMTDIPPNFILLPKPDDIQSAAHVTEL